MKTHIWPNSSKCIMSILLLQNRVQDLKGELLLAMTFSTILMLPGQSLILLSIKLKMNTFCLFDDMQASI